MDPTNDKPVITVIPARTQIGQMSGPITHKRRVAGYARVSKDGDDQLSSYEAQVDYYTNYINENPLWEFVGVYSDEGVTGTNTKNRDGFNQMVEDALNGKIDLILTKSVSRFARNTVDSLITVRKLKEKGVEIYFEKENIYTLDSKGEVMITIMSSLAQEESRSISENVTWGQRKRMRDGKVTLPYSQFLGYEKGEDGLPKIVESEAKIIRLIYALFLEGKTYRTIANYLTEQSIPTPRGKKQWGVRTVVSILSNEKYKGDALLQKTYTVDFLTKTQKINEGEIQQYYVKNSHPAIIDPATFDLVQSEIKQRGPVRRQLNNGSPFAAKIICGQCGGFYGSKVWHSADRHKTHIWQCNRKYGGGTFCDTPHMREEAFRAGFVEAFNQILGSKERYIAQFEELLPLLADTSSLEEQRKILITEQIETEDRLRLCIAENTREIRNQEEYEQRYNELSDKLTKLDAQIKTADDEILDQVARKEKIRRFLDELRQTGNIVTEFDEELWISTVDSVTVGADQSMTFTFKDGSKVPVAISATK